MKGGLVSEVNSRDLMLVYEPEAAALSVCCSRKEIKPEVTLPCFQLMPASCPRGHSSMIHNLHGVPEPSVRMNLYIPSQTGWSPDHKHCYVTGSVQLPMLIRCLV